MNSAEKRNLKISLGLNIASVMLFIIAAVVMLSQPHMADEEKSLSATALAWFKYYTVDTNTLAGLVCLVMAVFEIRLLKGKIKALPKWLYSLKQLSVVGVAVTFLTVTVILAPLAEKGYFSLFRNANLFYHLIIPVICMVSFLFFERTSCLRFRQTFIGMITYFIYGIFYVINVTIHMTDGVVSSKYDWYGIFSGALAPGWVMMLIMTAGAWLVSFILWRVNHKRDV